MLFMVYLFGWLVVVGLFVVVVLCRVFIMFMLFRCDMVCGNCGVVMWCER